MEELAQCVTTSFNKSRDMMQRQGSNKHHSGSISSILGVRDSPPPRPVMTSFPGNRIDIAKQLGKTQFNAAAAAAAAGYDDDNSTATDSTINNGL